MNEKSAFLSRDAYSSSAFSSEKRTSFERLLRPMIAADYAFCAFYVEISD